ncbi:MAG: hypothetical protein JW832_11000 [Deltaproteobacteria bacterium]|nr:hypothetical protein [Deltaproteobacteria bacterium]
MAASQAFAAVAFRPVTDDMLRVFNLKSLSFGRHYIIPKPFDRRVFFEVSTAVAEAAVSSGVARANYPGRDAYRKILEERYAKTIARFCA